MALNRPQHLSGSMSQLGQTEKNSVRAYVFRFALKLGHCSMHSACLKSARLRHSAFTRFAGSVLGTWLSIVGDRLLCPFSLICAPATSLVLCPLGYALRHSRGHHADAWNWRYCANRISIIRSVSGEAAGRHASNIMHDGSRLRRKVFSFNGRNVGAQSRGNGGAD